MFSGLQTTGVSRGIAVLAVMLLAACKTMPTAQDGPSATSSTPSSAPPKESTRPPPPSDAKPAAPAAPATPPYLVHPTPAERELQQQSSQFSKVVMGGVLQTLLERAPAQLLACQLKFRKDDKAKKQCLAAVIVVTGISGLSRGYTVAVRDQAKNDQLEAARKVTDDMAADNQRLQAMVDTSAAVLKESRTRLARVKEDLQAKRITKDDADRERRTVEGSIQLLGEQAASAKRTQDEYKKAADELKFKPAERKAIDVQIEQMDKKIKSLESTQKQMRDALAPSAY